MKVIVGPDKTVVAGGLHPSSDSICFPGTPDRVAGGDQLYVLWERFSVHNRVVLTIVDNEEFVFRTYLCGDIVASGGPRHRWKEDACWRACLSVRHPTRNVSADINGRFW